MNCRYGSADDAPALEPRDSGPGQRRSVIATIAAAWGRLLAARPDEHLVSAWVSPVGIEGRRPRGCLQQCVRAAKRLGLATPAETDLVFTEAATRLRGPQAGATVTTFGPCVGRDCTSPAEDKSRRCGPCLDRLVDRLGY